MNFMICELYLNEVIKRKKAEINIPQVDFRAKKIIKGPSLKSRSQTKI